MPYCEQRYIYQSSTVQQLYVDFNKVYDSIMTEEVCSIPPDFSMYMELIPVIKMCLVSSIKMNICLMLLHWELPETRKCLTVCYYCFRMCPSEGSRKPGGENEWDTLPACQWWWCKCTGLWLKYHKRKHRSSVTCYWNIVVQENPEKTKSLFIF